jgi:hypothetical protein
LALDDAVFRVGEHDGVDCLPFRLPAAKDGQSGLVWCLGVAAGENPEHWHVDLRDCPAFSAFGLFVPAGQAIYLFALVILLAFGALEFMFFVGSASIGSNERKSE